MARTLKVCLLVVGALVLIGTAAWGYDWYHEHYIEPKRLQMLLLGRVVVTPKDLKEIKSSFGIRGGSIGWLYRPESLTNDLAAFCAGRALQDCRFSKDAKINDNATWIYVFMEDGVLQIQEAWD
jgi:hypothetical protein